MFHGFQAIAKLGQSIAALAAAAAIEWPQFSGNLADYPEFMKKWMSAGQKCSTQLEDDQLCKIFRERCMSPTLQRRLAYFFTMDQLWDFLEMAMDKPRQAMESCVAAVEKLKPVKQADSECLRIWYVELRAIGERAKMGGVYAHLLMEAVVDKILNGLPPKEKQVVWARIAKPVANSSVDTLQPPERLCSTCGDGSCPGRQQCARRWPRRRAPFCEGNQEMLGGGLQGGFPPAVGVQEVPEHGPHQQIHSLP